MPSRWSRRVASSPYSISMRHLPLRTYSPVACGAMRKERAGRGASVVSASTVGRAAAGADGQVWSRACVRRRGTAARDPASNHVNEQGEDLLIKTELNAG